MQGRPISSSQRISSSFQFTRGWTNCQHWLMITLSTLLLATSTVDQIRYRLWLTSSGVCLTQLKITINEFKFQGNSRENPELDIYRDEFQLKSNAAPPKSSLIGRVLPYWPQTPSYCTSSTEARISNQAETSNYTVITPFHMLNCKLFHLQSKISSFVTFSLVHNPCTFPSLD